MFYFTHTLNEGTEYEKTITETRYIGDEPKNYVYFNCADPVENEEYNYATSCEVWRIIGVFDVEKEIDDPENAGQKITVTEQRMKLVTGSPIKDAYWNTASSNDWTTATLKTYLNTDYYNDLQVSAKDMIDEAKYYLGAASYIQTTEQLYTAERGTTLCASCNGDNSKLTWQGNLGLMYPSDEYMVYGNDVNVTCYSNPSGCSSDNARTGWVHNSNKLSTGSSTYSTWFMSPSVGFMRNGLFAQNGCELKYTAVLENSYEVRPVVYLSSSVQIVDGDGSEGNPYKLKK